MDVVKRNINELGGHVQIHSTAGQGSTVRIRLPLTLAILDGQLARVGKEVYVVPIVSIVETIQVTRGAVNSVAQRRPGVPAARRLSAHRAAARAVRHRAGSHRPARRPADDRRGRRQARGPVRRRADVAAAGGHQESRNQFPAGDRAGRRHHARRRPRGADPRRPRRHHPFPGTRGARAMRRRRRHEQSPTTTRAALDAPTPSSS